MSVRAFIQTRVYVVIMLGYLITATGCAINQAHQGSVEIDENIIVEEGVQQEFDEALQLLQKDELTPAIVLLNNVVEKETRLVAPYVNLAMAHRRSGDEKLAEANLLKALSIDQAHPVASNELAMMYRKQGRFSEAKSTYNKALSENADYLPIIRNLGILCDLYLRDPQCAYEQFQKYQARVPDDKTIRIWIADVKTRMQQ